MGLSGLTGQALGGTYAKLQGTERSPHPTLAADWRQARGAGGLALRSPVLPPGWAVSNPAMQQVLVSTPPAPSGRSPQAGPDLAGREGKKAPDPTFRDCQTQPVPHPNPLWRGAHASRRPHCLQIDHHPAPCSSAPRGGTGGPQHGEWPPKVSRGSAGGLTRSNAPGRGAQGEWPPR